MPVPPSASRRRVLRGAAGTLALSVPGHASAHEHDHPDGAHTPTPDDDPTATPSGEQPTTTDDDDGYAPLGRVGVDGAAEAVVGPDDRTVYVAALDGFATVDVSDPTAPAVLAERRRLLADREEGPLQRLQDCAIEDDRLVVAGPASEKSLNGFLWYDVSDPADPQRLAVFETDHGIHNCDVADGYVYLTGTDAPEEPLVVVDVRDDDPTEVARWSPLDNDDRWEEVARPLRTLHDVFVQDGVAYCAYWDAGTWLLDVSDPTAPTYSNRVGDASLEDLIDRSEEGVTSALLERPGNVHYVAVNDDASVLGVGVEAWDREETDRVGGPGGVTLYDVRDPTDPSELARIEPPPTGDPTLRGTWTTAHNFELAGDRLYTSWYQGGVKIHDVSDPAAPRELAWWRAPEEASFWTAQLAVPGEFFVASSHRAGTAAFEGVYTFPDRPGRQQDPPPLADGTSTPHGSPSTVTPSPTPHGSPSTATPSPTPTETETGTATNAPGFGALAALAGLGLGAWRVLRDEKD